MRSDGHTARYHVLYRGLSGYAGGRLHVIYWLYWRAVRLSRATYTAATHRGTRAFGAQLEAKSNTAYAYTGFGRVKILKMWTEAYLCVARSA